MALQKAVQLFDFSLSLSVDREMSRAVPGPRPLTQRRLHRRIETLNFAIRLPLGAALTLLAGVMARRWLILEHEKDSTEMVGRMYGYSRICERFFEPAQEHREVVRCIRAEYRPYLRSTVKLYRDGGERRGRGS